jgi:hypothetical protein
LDVRFVSPATITYVYLIVSAGTCSWKYFGWFLIRGTTVAVEHRIRKIQVICVVLLGGLSLSACSIKETVKPVGRETVSTAEVCIIENPAVRQGYLPQFQQALREQGYKVKTLGADASTRDCPTVCTYTARWSWDLTTYMSYSQILVFRNGEKAGEAVYDSRHGGGRLDKFIHADEKIHEQVVELFPTHETAVTSTMKTNDQQPRSVANLDAVPIEEMCFQPSKVDREECLGHLRITMGKDEVLGVLGTPDAKSKDEMTLRYGDRVLRFDDKSRLVEIAEAPSDT